MIWALSDLHFDPIGNKSMNIFNEIWKNHEGKISKYWNENVKEEDLVLLPGDISWGLKLNEAEKDLEKINKFKGKKIISKGNHDYWWTSLNKMNSLNLDTISFLNNNSLEYKGISIVGSRGWKSKDYADFSKDDEKIYERELQRLKISLDSAKNDGMKIAMLHYPPFNLKLEPNDFAQMLSEYNVDICIYGHLHAHGHKFIKEGNVLGVKYICVSSDYVDFKVQKILEV